MNSSWIRQDPNQNTLVPAGLSLLVPGLGQIVLGQFWRGVLLFICSALLCFGMGLCNVVLAWDAHCLAKDRRNQDITTSCQSDLMHAISRVYAIVRIPIGLFRAVRSLLGL